MKINYPKKSFKKPLIIALVVATIVLAAGFGWYSFSNRSESPSSTTAPVNTINYDPPTDEEKQETAQKKEEIINKSPDQAESTNSETDATVTITRANQADNKIYVRTYVNGMNSGTCDITFSKEGQQPITRQVAITFEATSASCNTDVDVGEFGQSGDWQLKVIAKKDGKVSPAASYIVNVDK